MLCLRDCIRGACGIEIAPPYQARGRRGRGVPVYAVYGVGQCWGQGSDGGPWLVASIWPDRLVMTSGAHAEATSIFSDVIAEITQGDANLLAVMRRCLHACRLLGWDTQAAWFAQEIQGYSEQAELPPYRIVQGTERWRTRALAQIHRRDDYAAAERAIGAREGDGPGTIWGRGGPVFVFSCRGGTL